MLLTAPFALVGVQTVTPNQMSEGVTAAQVGPVDPADDVIIIGHRIEKSVESEKDFTEDEIDNERVNTIGDLIARLGSSIDPAGSTPMLLVNGKPVGFDQSILSYPPEALARLSVLKTGAGTRYGAQAGQKVVNLVLKTKFASLDATASASAATEGGQQSGTLAFTRSVIDHDTRWNARLQASWQGALLAAARQSQRVGASASIQETTTPSSGLQDRSGDFTTLLPSVKNSTFGLSYTRPIGPLSTTAGIEASVGTALGEAGLPNATINLPQPDGIASALRQVQLVATRPYRTISETRSLGLTLSTAGSVRGVQSNASFNYSFTGGRSIFESGVDLVSLQRDTLERGVLDDPAASFSPSYLATNKTDSTSRVVTARIELRKRFITLPAGSLTWSINVSTFAGTSVLSDTASDVNARSQSGFRQSATRLSVSIPVSRRGTVFRTVGDLALSFSIGRQLGSGGSASSSYAGGFSWSPLDPIQIDGSIDDAANPPSADSLYGPVKTTIYSLFDYRTEVLAAPIWTTGGNPDLLTGHQRLESLSLVIRPAQARGFSVTVGYRRSISSDNPVNFLELTPAIEAAFPERIVRDQDGRLVAVDARPLNVAKQEDASAEFGLTGRTTLGARNAISDWQRRRDETTMDFTMTYRTHLVSSYVLKLGGPVVNRLEQTGQPRNQIETRLNLTKGPIGFSFSSDWRSSARLATGGDDLKVQDPLLIELGSSIELSQLFPDIHASSFARHLRLSVSVQNALDDRRRVHRLDGSIPPGYDSKDSDPLGRTVQVAVRKLF